MKLGSKPSKLRQIKRPTSIHLFASAELCINLDKKSWLNSWRMQLLAEINRTGSLSAAARVMTCTYKTAWDHLAELNSISPTPLTRAATGGAGGGGMLMTLAGKHLLKSYQLLARDHAEFVATLQQGLTEPEAFEKKLNRMRLRISARNILPCKIIGIQNELPWCVVKLQLEGGIILYAQITHSSASDLGLKPKLPVLAVIKTNSITFEKISPSTKLRDQRAKSKPISTKKSNSVLDERSTQRINILPTQVNGLQYKNKSQELLITIPNGHSITAIHPKPRSATSLKIGDSVFVYIPYGQILIAIPA